jgi:hypothetical protein
MQVGLEHYFSSPQGFNGFLPTGALSLENLRALSDTMMAKSMNASYDYGAGTTGGGINNYQSLEAQLKVLTWNTVDKFRLWNKLPKGAVRQLSHDHDEVSSWGDPVGGFFGFSESPVEGDGEYVRRSTKIKAIGTMGSVQFVLNAIDGAHGSPMAIKLMERIMWLLARINHSSYFGDSQLVGVPATEGPEFDGLDVLTDPESVYDAEGDGIDGTVLQTIAASLLDEFAAPTDILLGTRAVSDFDKTLTEKERIIVPAGGDIVAGTTATAMRTSAGVIRFQPDVFLGTRYCAPNPGLGGVNIAKGVNAPIQPASVTANVTGTNGDFTKGKPTGDVRLGYAVSLGNRHGESAVTFLAANVDVSNANAVAGVRVDLTVTNPAMMVHKPEWIAVYRTPFLADNADLSTNLADYSMIFKKPVSSQAPSATTVVSDVNLYLPFTEKAWVLQFTPDIIEFLQLMPLMQVNLPMVSPTLLRFAVLMFGALKLYGRKKIKRILNIGAVA